MALICDTGPLYAAMDRNDIDHDACARLFATVGETLLVPAPVVVELDWLAGSRLDPSAFAAFLADVVEGAVQVVDPIKADCARARELCLQLR